MDLPTISIVVAVYNEEKHLAVCLDSLLRQSYAGPVEIIVVDGGSSDGTLDIVGGYCSKHENIQLLHNENKFQSFGRNIGFRAAKGSLVAYLDGHSYAAEDWLEQLFTAFTKLKKENKKICAVGSVHRNPTEKGFTYAQTVAFNSVLGGAAMSSYSEKDQLRKVNWAYACLYDAKILKEAGYYDTKYEKGEDLELNLRLTKKLGYDLYICPDAITYYYKKESLEELFTQMKSYGYWRYLVMRDLDEPLFPYALPALFIMFLLALTALSLIFPIVFIFLILIIIAYVLVLFAAAFWESIMKRKMLMSLFLIYMFIHFGYGSGVLKALFFSKIKKK